MKKIFILCVLFILAAGALTAQEKATDSVRVIRDYVNPEMLTQSNTKAGVAQSKEVYFKGLTEAEKTTPVFRYVADKSKAALHKNAVMPSDTVITPTIRYYPKRKE